MLLSSKRTFASPNIKSLLCKSMRYATTVSTSIKEYQATLAVDCENVVGECPIWDFRRELLCWIDIEGAKFWTYNPINKQSQCHQLPERVGSFALCNDDKFDDDTYLIAFEKGPAFYNISSAKMIGDRIFDFEPNKVSRPNDGRVDRQGRFVFGGQEEPFDPVTPRLNSAAYRINTDLSHDILFEGVGCGNSTCFSKNGKTMYFTDTLGMFGESKQSIFQYDYFEDNRKPNNRQIFAVYDRDDPALNIKNEAICYVDGSVVDEEDAVWNAGVGSSRVWRFNKEGNIDHCVHVPEPWVTCAAFGGKDLDTMYITTLNFGEESELMTGIEKGALYEVKLPIKGCRENVFLGF